MWFGVVMVMMPVVVIVMMIVFVLGNIVVMEAEKTFDEEHREHAREQRNGDPANGHGAGRQASLNSSLGGWERDSEAFSSRSGVDECVRQHVEHTDAKHDAGDEAHGELHPAMRELEPNGDHTADDRRD